MPQFVFAKAMAWIANRTNQPARQIVLPANVVNDSLFDWVKEHAVDRKVTPQSSIFARGAEANFVGTTTVTVAHVLSECGYRMDPADGGPRTVITPNAAPMAKVRN